MDLSQHQMDWVTEHLGHSIAIHKTYYRQTSAVIERAQVAKLLLLQDSGATDQLTNKKLEDIRFSGRMVLQVSVLLWAATHTFRDVCVNVVWDSQIPRHGTLHADQTEYIALIKGSSLKLLLVHLAWAVGTQA